jgi:hypothetical protein
LEILDGAEDMISTRIILYQPLDNVLVLDFDGNSLIEHLLHLYRLFLLCFCHLYGLCACLSHLLHLGLLFEYVVAVLLPLSLYRTQLLINLDVTSLELLIVSLTPCELISQFCILKTQKVQLDLQVI